MSIKPLMDQVNRTPIFLSTVNNPNVDYLYVMVELEEIELDGVKIEGLCALFDQDLDVFKHACKNREELLYLLNQRDLILKLVPDEKYRVCSHCENIMQAGYVFESDSSYYCSDNCLYTVVTEEEYQERYDNGNGDAYWTEWYNS